MTEKHKCPPHYWVLDNDDVGECIHCHEVRDFRKLQEMEARRLSNSPIRGAIASLGLPRTRRKTKYGL